MIRKKKTKTEKQLLDMIDQITMFAEALGGLRKQLLNQGFTPEAAEIIILKSLKEGPQ